VARFMGRPTSGSGLMVELPILTAVDGRGGFAARPTRRV